MSIHHPSRPNHPSPRQRPKRSAAPALPAVETMDRSHRQTLQVLAHMKRLTELLAQPGHDAAAAPLAAQACSFFNGPARGHHEIEEIQVFPGLLADGKPELLAHVRRLQQDHMWLEEDWLELEPHLQAVARGYVTEHQAFLCAALPEFTSLCEEHMALEESLVYPEARRRQAERPVGG